MSPFVTTLATTIVRRRVPAAACAVALALASTGCGVSPRQEDTPASSRCTSAGRICHVHLVRGSAPLEFGHGKHRFALRLGPAEDRTVQIATVRDDAGRWLFDGAFGDGSGSVGSRVSDVSVDRVGVDAADARVVFHRGRAD